MAIDISKEDSIVWLTDFVTPSLLSLFCNSIQSSGDGSIVEESFAWRGVAPPEVDFFAWLALRQGIAT